MLSWRLLGLGQQYLLTTYIYDGEEMTTTISEDCKNRVEQALLTAWEFVEACTSWQGHNTWAPDDRAEALEAINDGFEALGCPQKDMPDGS